MPPFKLQVLPGKNLKVKYLSQKMAQYVHENYPTSSKRLVIYAPELENTTCPYLKHKSKVFYQMKNSHSWDSFYDFVPEMRTASGSSHSEIQKKLDYIRVFGEKICMNICILDTNENWVFSINEASSIESGLNAFKD